MRSVRVVIVEDDVRVRAALASLLRFSPGFDVTAQAGDGQEARRVLDARTADVVLLDVSLPEADVGLDLIRHCSDRLLPVVAISAQAALHGAALGAGATSFVDKGVSPDKLLSALRRAAVRPLGQPAACDVSRVTGPAHCAHQRPRDRGEEQSR